MAESQPFAKKVKVRSLNGNFNPKLKIVHKIRFNTLSDHLEPYTNNTNYDKVRKLRVKWKKANKFTESEKKHEYRHLVQKGTSKYIKKTNTIYGTYHDYYKLLEGSKKPKGQKVLWLMNEMLVGVNYVNEVVPNGKAPSIFLAQEDDHKDIKHLRKLMEYEFREKVLNELPIFVWMSAILTPPIREDVKYYLKRYNDGDYYLYNEAIQEIENKLSYLADIEFDSQQLQNQSNFNINRNHNQSEQRQQPQAQIPQQPPHKKTRFSFTPTKSRQPTHKRQA